MMPRFWLLHWLKSLPPLSLASEPMPSVKTIQPGRPASVIFRSPPGSWMPKMKGESNSLRGMAAMSCVCQGQKLGAGFGGLLSSVVLCDTYCGNRPVEPARSVLRSSRAGLCHIERRAHAHSGVRHLTTPPASKSPVASRPAAQAARRSRRKSSPPVSGDPSPRSPDRCGAAGRPGCCAGLPGGAGHRP